MADFVELLHQYQDTRNMLHTLTAPSVLPLHHTFHFHHPNTEQHQSTTQFMCSESAEEYAEVNTIVVKVARGR